MIDSNNSNIVSRNERSNNSQRIEQTYLLRTFSIEKDRKKNSTYLNGKIHAGSRMRFPIAGILVNFPCPCETTRWLEITYIRWLLVYSASGFNVHIRFFSRRRGDIYSEPIDLQSRLDPSFLSITTHKNRKCLILHSNAIDETIHIYEKHYIKIF